MQDKLDKAVALHQSGNFEKAETIYREVLAAVPDATIVHHNLGLIELALGRHDEARRSLERAVELDSGLIEAHGNLGNLWLNAGEPAKAETAYRQGLAAHPNQPDLTYNLGRALYEQARWHDAETAFRDTIQFNPTHALAHWNLSHVLLLQGRFGEAWPEFEWRWQCPGFTTQLPNLGKPKWDGGEVRGKTILVFAEQGFGDTIQFARYLPLLTKAGAEVIFLCQPELQRLLSSIDGVHLVTSDLNNLPAFDAYCPLMSLPMLLGTDTEMKIPAETPYMEAPVGGPSVPSGDGLKVGLVWAGRATHGTEHQRSLRLETLRPLIKVPGCRFYNLQQGERRDDPIAEGLNDQIIEVDGPINDFADTAHLIGSLDLIICVDTAVAHLAGALEKPVWVLVPKICDWRWLLARDDSPWYPSMRLFRQDSLNEWRPVVEHMATALARQS